MKLFDISNHGLAAIAVLVTLLWGVLLMERSYNQRVQRDYQDLQRNWRTIPAAGPEQAKPSFGPRPAWADVS